MATLYTFICNQCNKTFKWLPVKGDGIDRGPVANYVCSACHFLNCYLLPLGEKDKEKHLKCSNCNQTGTLIRYDDINKPCPRPGCKGHLHIDPKEGVFLVD